MANKEKMGPPTLEMIQGNPYNYTFDEVAKCMGEERAMIKKDIILEVNTSSIMNASDEPLPRYSIIDRYVQLGGRRVVLGSDAHISVKLGNAFSSVVRKLPNTCVIGYFKNRVFYEL